MQTAGQVIICCWNDCLVLCVDHNILACTFRITERLLSPSLRCTGIKNNESCFRQIDGISHTAQNTSDTCFSVKTDPGSGLNNLRRCSALSLRNCITHKANALLPDSSRVGAKLLTVYFQRINSHAPRLSERYLAPAANAALRLA